MREVLRTTNDFTSIDHFNIKMAQSLKDMVGQTITINKIAVGKDEDKDRHEEVPSAAFITNEGNFGTISNTVVELASALIDIINEKGPQKVQVSSRKSNGGRDYLVLTLIG